MSTSTSVQPLRWMVGAPIGTLPPPPEAFKGWAPDPDPPPEAASIASVINAVYSTTSKGASSDLDAIRLRRLCAPCARIMITQRNDRDLARPRVLTIDEYLESVRMRFPEGDVHEYETGRSVQQFGAVGHVLSAWVAARRPGAEPLARGVSSIQLFHDGYRWWLLSLLSDIERPGVPIPDDLKRPLMPGD